MLVVIRLGVDHDTAAEFCQQHNVGKRRTRLVVAHVQRFCILGEKVCDRISILLSERAIIYLVHGLPAKLRSQLVA